jgi:hypothetical protein
MIVRQAQASSLGATSNVRHSSDCHLRIRIVYVAVAA